MMRTGEPQRTNVSQNEFDRLFSPGHNQVYQPSEPNVQVAPEAMVSSFYYQMPPYMPPSYHM